MATNEKAIAELVECVRSMAMILEEVRADPGRIRSFCFHGIVDRMNELIRRDDTKPAKCEHDPKRPLSNIGTDQSAQKWFDYANALEAQRDKLRDQQNAVVAECLRELKQKIYMAGYTNSDMHKMFDAKLRELEGGL